MKPIALLSALAALGGTLAAPTLAQAPAAVTSADTATDISLAGQVVMRIRTGAGGYTAQQRADAVLTRLTPIMSLEPRPRAQDVSVQTVSPTQSNILVRGHLLLTVDGTLARANGQSPELLAQAWAANLRRTIPQVTSEFGGQYADGHL